MGGSVQASVAGVNLTSASGKLFDLCTVLYFSWGKIRLPSLAKKEEEENKTKTNNNKTKKEEEEEEKSHLRQTGVLAQI